MDTTLQLVPMLSRLNDHGVEFVVVGGVAAAAHGSVRLTYDVDVCAPFTEANLSKVLAALRDLRPRFRMRPDRMPVPDDPAYLSSFQMLNLLTDWGVIDLLREVEGVGSF